MAKMPSVLRPRLKRDEVEVELELSRTAARLEALVGGSAATSDDLPHADAPAEAVEVDQLPEAEQPLDAEASVSGELRDGSRPVVVIGSPADVGGVTAGTNDVNLHDRPAPDQADMVGVIGGRGGASPGRPPDEWRSKADAYILAQAFGVAPVAVPVRADDAPVRGETGEDRRIQLTLDTSMVDARQVSPAGVEHTASETESDPESSAGATENRRTPKPRSPKEGQLRGTRSRPASGHPARPAKGAPAPAAVAASCPYCAVLIQPTLGSSRGCPRCRHRIIVRRVDGRAVYLTEAALLVFDAERRRIASSSGWTRERQRWLKLASAAGAPVQRAARLAAALPSEGAVEAARALYMAAVERSFRSAKRDRGWKEASKIRREQAMALFRLAGSPHPPPEGIVQLWRDGLAAELHGISEFARDAELVSAACCDVCQADDGRICRITRELRMPLLPHQGCPMGLCRCRWDLTARDRAAVRRNRRRRTRANQRADATELVSTV